MNLYKLHGGLRWDEKIALDLVQPVLPDIRVYLSRYKSCFCGKVKSSNKDTFTHCVNCLGVRAGLLPFAPRLQLQKTLKPLPNKVVMQTIQIDQDIDSPVVVVRFRRLCQCEERFLEQQLARKLKF